MLVWSRARERKTLRWEELFSFRFRSEIIFCKQKEKIHFSVRRCVSLSQVVEIQSLDQLNEINFSWKIKLKNFEWFLRCWHDQTELKISKYSYKSETNLDYLSGLLIMRLNFKLICEKYCKPHWCKIQLVNKLPMTRFNVTPQKTFLLRSAMSRFFISFFNSWDISHILFGVALLKKVSLFVGFKRNLLTHYQQRNSFIFRVNNVTHPHLKCLNEMCLWQSQWLRFISRFNVELNLLLSQERQIPNVIV